MLLGLKCDEEVTGVMHVGNLMALGYEVEDVTARDLGVDEMWTWEEDKERSGEGAWTLFRVELWETSDAVLNFLSEERVGGEGVVRRVSFTEGERGLMRLLVAGWGSQWQVEELERSMREVARSVRRIDGDRKGLVVLGIGERGSQETNNGVIRVSCEAVENGDEGMEVTEEEANGGDESGVEMSIRFADGEGGAMEVDGADKRDEEVDMQDEAHMTHMEVAGEHGGIDGEGEQGEGDGSGENAVEGAAESEMEVQIEGHMGGGEGEERVVEVETVETGEKLEHEVVEEVVVEERESGGGGAGEGEGEEEVEDEDEGVVEGEHVEEEHLEEEEVIDGDEEVVHVDVEECEVVDDGHECAGHEDGTEGGEGTGTGGGEMEIVGEEELEVKGEGAESGRGDLPDAGPVSSTTAEIGLASGGGSGPESAAVVGAGSGSGAVSVCAEGAEIGRAHV